MWRSKAIAPESAPPPSRFSGLYRALLIAVLLLAIVVFLFPILFRPAAETPADVQFESPLSLTLQISNQNFTPLADVEYTCEGSKLTLANGSEVTNAKILNRGTTRRLPGRRGIAARCEAAYLVNAPVKAVEYKLTLTYRTPPWPHPHTAVYRIAAQLDGNGKLTGWKVN